MVSGWGEWRLNARRGTLCFMKVLALALSLLSVSFTLAATQSGVTVVGPGDVAPLAPAFLFRPIEGPPFALESLRGRVVVLKFWATWCSDCMREMPQARTLLKRFAARGVQFLGISKDLKKPPQEVLEVARNEGQFYPLMADRGPAESRITKLYEVSWIPTVILIDAEGKAQALAKDLDGDNLEIFATAIEKSLQKAQAGKSAEPAPKVPAGPNKQLPKK